MENHSYDNYLGMLKGRGDGFPLGADGEPEASNRNADGEPIRAHHLTSTVQRPQVPSQSWHATHHQWGHGKHDGFVTATQVVVPAAGDVDQAACEGPAAAVGMGYWTEDDLPFYYGLARTFPVADRWFSSCLGPTFPNRRFLIAGTAHGLLDDAPSDLLDYPPNGTIFDLLDRHGISWANYHPVAAGQSKLRRYARHERRMARRRLLAAGRSFPSVNRGVKKDLQFTADIFPIGIRRYLRHVHSTDQFFADADNGTLPAFSIVDPDFEAYSEENPQDISKGESFAAEVINRCLHGKGWPGTLLIWVYDEHGGYYDHVPPPAGGAARRRRGTERDRHPEPACSPRCGWCSRRRSRSPATWTPDRAATTATGSGCRPSWCRRTRAPITSAARCSTTPPSSSWSSRSGTCPR